MTETFDYNKSEQYTLSIRLSTDGFSFSIYDPIHKNVLYHRNYPVNSQRSMAANVKSFLAAIEEMKNTYKNIYILTHSDRYTIIPLEFFEDDMMEDIFYQNIKSKMNEVILCNILGKSNSVVIFSFDKLAHVFLSEQFPKAKFFSSISPQIEYLTIKNKCGNNRKLYLNIHTSNIDIIGFNDKHLLIANSYNINNDNDIVYFTLNIWQQLGYNQEDDELFVYGLQYTREKVIPEISKYIRNIFSINLQAELNVTATAENKNIPFDVQSLILCE